MARRVIVGLAAVAVLLCLASVPAHAYTLIGMQVNVTFAGDGSLHVNERYSLLLDNDTEIETFQNYRTFGQNTLLEWRRFLHELNYHVSGNYTPSNTKISARQVVEIGSRSAELMLDYDLPYGATLANSVKSRLTVYTFDPNFLSFPRASTGEVILPLGTTLVFNVPSGATVDSQFIYPQPVGMQGGTVTWVGPATSNWKFRYSVEESLPEEVKAYFDGLYAYGNSLLPWLLPAGLLVLVAGFLYNKFVREKRSGAG